MTRAVAGLRGKIGVKAACEALGLVRSQFYRQQQPRPAAAEPKAAPARKLTEAERAEVRSLLNSPRFADQAPREVYASLLDTGCYVCSVRSMYRILNEHDAVRERRDQLRHPAYTKPELLATAPNQVWSWDITKLYGPVKWSYFYLYTVLDIYSRYVVGWMIALREAGHLAELLIAETCQRQAITPGQLTLHADRGKPMLAKPLAFLLADLGVTKSHSRPYTPNDNPFSEAHYKTMKYRPDFPEFFDSLLGARDWGHPFFHWYNFEHHHTALGLLTPADVHYGRAAEVLQQRQSVLQLAYDQHPERFVRGTPHPAALPEAVYINPPKQAQP